MMRARSITALLAIGWLTCAGACSEAAPAGDATGHDGSGGRGIGSDATTPPPAPDDSGAAGNDSGPSPPMSDATTPIDSGGGGDDAPVAPPLDAFIDTTIPAPDGGGGSPSYDAGVARGCASNPNPPDPTAGWTSLADAYPPSAGAAFPHLEYPYNLGPQDNCVTSLPMGDMTSPCRFRREGSLMTFWIFQNDQSHLPPDSGLAPTDPRIEMHWSTFTAQDAHPRRMW